MTENVKRRGRPTYPPPSSDDEWVVGTTNAALVAGVSPRTIQKWTSPDYDRGEPARLEWGTDFKKDDERGGMSGANLYRRARLLELGELAAVHKGFTAERPELPGAARPKPQRKRGFKVLNPAEVAAAFDMPELAVRNERYFDSITPPRWFREVQHADTILYRTVQEKLPGSSDPISGAPVVRTYVLFPDDDPEDVQNYLKKLAFDYFGIDLPGDSEDLEYSEFLEKLQKT